MFTLFESGGGQFPEYIRLDRNTLFVYNAGDDIIFYGTAVNVSGHVSTEHSPEGIFYGIAAVNDEGCWGIAAENILPHTSGIIVLNGIAKAFINGSGDYAVPGSNGKLVAGTSGKALVLDHGTEKIPGTVQLGYSSGGVSVKDDYTGAFKLRHIEGRTFELCHGVYINNPNHTYHNSAGFTDLPGDGTVPKQNIILPEDKYSANIYLNACNNDGIYSVSIAFDSYSAGVFDFIRIGSIMSDGTVTQSYKPAEDTIYFGRQWYL